jgi:predicted amidohydrolase
MTNTVSITLWATNVGRPLASGAEWLADLDAVASEARAEGSALLVAPEYVSEQWLTFQGPDAAPTDEAALMAEAGAALLDGIQDIADARGIDILAGTWPVARGDGRYTNGAHLFTVGGKEPLVQHKLCPTPAERDPATWHIASGTRLKVFEWQGLRCAILTCLDIELPALSVRLAAESPELDLILCPSMTEKRSGYNRVFGCAKARAVELMTTVAVVGVIGEVPLGDGRPNTSGAAVYVPCEPDLGYDGRFAEIGPFDGADPADPLGPRLHVKDIPVGAVRRLRETQPEVWPGAWTGEGVTLDLPGEAPALSRLRKSA